MKLLREYIRGLLIETAIGQCYPHAVKMAKGSSQEEFSDLTRFKVVHGRVTDKYSGESVLHAWVEKGGMVFDWQTHSTKPDGIPKDIYYDMYSPEIHNEYTAEETMINCLKSGQAGPWVLRETRLKQISKPKFTDLRQHLAGSSFLDADPAGDLDEDTWSSEAAVVLRDDLNDYFDSKFEPGYLTAVVKVDMGWTDPKAGKDSILKNATYYFKGGLHFVEIMLADIDDGTVIRDMGRPEQKVYEVILHELLHMQQFLRFSKGEPTDKKWKLFMKEYQRRGGASGMGSDYFFFDEPGGASELETFSLQIATELVDALGQKAAISTLGHQPDYDTIRKNSASFRGIESAGNLTSRPEFKELIKRAKQYARLPI